MADLVEVRAGEKVADLGCGVGGTALWLARERGATVVGVDVNARLLELARRHTARAEGGRLVSFVAGDLRRTGLDDERFDVVWAQESVEQVAEHAQVLAEALRLLRPGGRLIVENILSRDARRSAPDARLVDAFKRACATPIPSDRSLEEAARAVGFIEVALRDVTPNTAPSFKRMYQLQRVTRPLFDLLDSLGLCSERQRGMRHGLALQRVAFARGLLLMGLLTARRPGSPTSTRLRIETDSCR